jgi:5-methylcytosine-specific restriction endonuclease McrA
MVFVVDTEHRPLSPCPPARARRLLALGKAAVWRRHPFTIILRRSVPEAHPEPLRVKIDPGSQTTGLAVVNDASGQVVWAAQLTHRGQQIRNALLARRAMRRSRRQRHTRYRPVRFANRRRRAGWLPPSLESRLGNVLTWVARLRRLAPIAAISQELVKFDTQLLQHPEIEGVQYQQGELAGYEVREYLLEKWGRQCAYCHTIGVPLQIEHIVPRTRGGSDRVSNLTLACEPCNLAKGTQTATEFGHPEVAMHAKQPLRDAAAVNATRWALYRRLQASGLPIETGTGGRTKWNRTQRGLPKAHWIDAACVGASTPPVLRIAGLVPLAITSTGHGVRQMCGTNRAGFPTRHRTRQTRHFGFASGDLVCARVPAGLKTAGRHVGRVLVRASGCFDLVTRAGRVQGVSHRFCQLVARRDGYAYAYRAGSSGASSPACMYGASAP